MEFQVSEELELIYSLMDQCMMILLQYSANHTNNYDMRVAIHLMIAFPFYASKIYQQFVSKIIKKITLENLPDYRIDFNFSSYGYKSLDIKLNNTDNIKLKQLLIQQNNWTSDENEKAIKHLLKELNDDLNQNNIIYKDSKENRTEQYNFYNVKGLNYESVFDDEYHKKDLEKLPKILMVAIFKDNRKPLEDIQCFGMNTKIVDEIQTRKSGTIILIKNKEPTSAFIYRATFNSHKAHI